MELGLLQKGNFRVGWAISESDEFYSSTEYYIFQWVFLHKGIRYLRSPKDISKIEFIMVSKEVLKEFIENVSERVEPQTKLRNPIDLTNRNIEKVFVFF